MELQGEDGSVVHLSETLPTDLGRGPGFAPDDRSVSRKQVRLQLQRISTSNSHFDFTLSIEVVGPNPICVIHANKAGDAADVQVEIVKPGSRSTLTVEDKFSLSIQEPVFYTLRDLGARIDSANCSGHDQPEGADSLGVAADADEEEGIAEAVARWQRRKQERFQGAAGAGAGAVIAADHCERVGVDLSKQVADDDGSRQMLVAGELENPENSERSREKEDDTDGVKRFGFIVEGSEFERYGKKAHDTSNWDWQIGRRPGNDSDDDEGEEEEEGGGLQQNRTSAGLKKKPKPKSKPRNEDDDDDWRGDSEGEKELLGARKRPAQARKSGPASHDLATTSESRVDPRKLRKMALPSLKVSRQGAASSKSTKIASKPGSRASKKDEDEEEEDDGDGDDLDGFLVDDVDEEDEAVGDEEDEWTDEDEDEEVEEDDEIEEDTAAAPASDKRGTGGSTRGDDRPLCKFGNKCFRKNKDHLAEFRH